jgi:hypothetical protein
MEPFDKNIISIIKKNLKKIGKLSVPLCQNKDSNAEDIARAINKIAHDTYEVIWLEEHSYKEGVSMRELKEEGVPSPLKT